MPKIGWKHSEESRRKMSIAAKNRQKKLNNHWWTNGTEEKFQELCPGEGWYLGHINAGWSGEKGRKRKEETSKRMQGNKHAVSIWKKWLIE